MAISRRMLTEPISKISAYKENSQAAFNQVVEGLDVLNTSFKGILSPDVGYQLGREIWSGVIHPLAQWWSEHFQIREAVMTFSYLMVNTGGVLCDAEIMESMIQLSLTWYSTYDSTSTVLEIIVSTAQVFEPTSTSFVPVLKVRILYFFIFYFS